MQLCWHIVTELKKIKSIQATTCLLFIVFSMNTLLGFACSVGINLGYNKYHHAKVCSACVHSSETKSKANENDCCSKVVTPFNLLSKVVPSSYHLIHTPDSFAISAFHLFLQPSLFLYNYFFITTTNYSPPVNIRIIIQSFLI